MLVDNLPETARVRISRYTFKHQADCTVVKRAINNIAMTGNPADISSTPVDLAILVVKNQFLGHGCLQQVTASGV